MRVMRSKTVRALFMRTSLGWRHRLAAGQYPRLETEEARTSACPTPTIPRKRGAGKINLPWAGRELVLFNSL